MSQSRKRVARFGDLCVPSNMRNEWDASEAARALVAKRKRYPTVCVICGAEFLAITAPKADQQRTCSNRCRSALRRQRAKASRNPAD